MKRAYVAPITFGLICLVAVGTIILLVPGTIFFPELSWGVEVGDTLQFDV